MAFNIHNSKHLICFILAIIVNAALTDEYPELLSRMFKRAAKDNGPIILVLDDDTQHSRGIMKVAESSSAEDDKSASIPNAYLNRLIQLLKRNELNKQKYQNEAEDKTKAAATKTVKKEHKLRFRDSLEIDRYQPKEREETRAVLRSPIVKELLTLRNSLRCGARDQCQDKCSDDYKGKKLTVCKKKCEKKFECDDEPDPCAFKDDCESSGECATSNECSGSTKGVILVTKKPSCPRC